VVVGALVGIGALLLAAAILSAAGSLRLHGACREALRELRDGERRLEPGAGPGRRLEDELRWYADVTRSGRDSGWAVTAAAVLALCAGAVVLGIWVLSTEPAALLVATVVILLVAAVVVGVLSLLEGRRFDGALRAAARPSALGGVRRLEDALVQVQQATAEARAAHRSWLRTRAATYPLAAQLASWRRRTFRRAAARRSRAVAALAHAVPVDLTGLSVRPPDGYPDGLRGLTPLAAAGPAPGPASGSGATRRSTPRPGAAQRPGAAAVLLDDQAWATAVADLSRAAERDLPRRTRWLSALAACAELRDDQPARESAARWALDAAALPPRTPGDARTDPLPDAVAIEPVRPETWEGALRRARAVGAGPQLLAETTLRYAYALVAVGAPLDPAVDAAAEVMTGTSEDYLTRVRPGFESLGATSAQLSRLVPQWHAPTPARTA
jgi:hypothetical protein